MQISDRELAQRLKSGDTQAFECLYDRYYGAIRKHLAGIVHDAHSVEDLVQEVFLRVWHKIDQWTGKGSLKAWIYKIATNQALYYLRSHKKKRMESIHREISSKEDPEEDSLSLAEMIRDESLADPEKLYAEKMTREYVYQQIQNLSPERQETLQLIYDEDFSIAQTSEMLGIPEGTVKSRLHYAIKQLSGDMKNFLG